MKNIFSITTSKLRHLSMAAVMLVSTVVGVSAQAQAEAADSTEATIKKLIEPRLGKDAKVDSVTKTPYAGLYEIQIDGDVIYTDAKAQYLFIGRVVDSQTYRDYTKEKIDSLNQVPFSGLPLDKAIKTVKGNGKRVIAIFEDPNCIYCKRLHKTLQEVDNITYYTFQYNILSPDSIVKSRNIWCAPNPSKAWNEWMVSGKEAPAAASTALRFSKTRVACSSMPPATISPVAGSSGV